MPMPSERKTQKNSLGGLTSHLCTVCEHLSPLQTVQIVACMLDAEFAENSVRRDLMPMELQFAEAWT